MLLHRRRAQVDLTEFAAVLKGLQFTLILNTRRLTSLPETKAPSHFRCYVAMLDSQPNRQSDESPLLSAEPQPFTRPFPDDVTALIIQHTLPRPRFSFKKDNLLLLNLCLVHSSWRHFAQRELFRDVVLPTSTAAVLFRKQAGRDLPKLVQTLRVGSPQSGRTSAFLAVVKSCGDALREIWLSRVGSVNMACLEGTKAETLILREIYLWPKAPSPDLHLPYLRSLAIAGEPGIALLKHSLAFPSLDILVLLDVPSYEVPPTHHSLGIPSPAVSLPSLKSLAIAGRSPSSLLQHFSSVPSLKTVAFVNLASFPPLHAPLPPFLASFLPPTVETLVLFDGEYLGFALGVVENTASRVKTVLVPKIVGWMALEDKERLVAACGRRGVELVERVGWRKGGGWEDEVLRCMNLLREFS